MQQTALPSGELDIAEILRECKDLMRLKTAVHERVKEYQFSLKSAR
jgi:hypothetical protein